MSDSIFSFQNMFVLFHSTLWFVDISDKGTYYDMQTGLSFRKWNNTGNLGSLKATLFRSFYRRHVVRF